VREITFLLRAAPPATQEQRVTHRSVWIQYRIPIEKDEWPQPPIIQSRRSFHSGSNGAERGPRRGEAAKLPSCDWSTAEPLQTSSHTTCPGNECKGLNDRNNNSPHCADDSYPLPLLLLTWPLHSEKPLRLDVTLKSFKPACVSQHKKYLWIHRGDMWMWRRQQMLWCWIKVQIRGLDARRIHWCRIS